MGVGIATVAVAAVAVADGSAPRGQTLLVQDLARGRVLYRGPVAPGAAVVLSYVHSSEHVPVRGTLVVEPDGTLFVSETAFAGFGPGLPEPRAGEPWRFEGGMIVVPGTGPRFPELRVRVAPSTRHRLRVPSGEALDLSSLMRDGGSVEIRVIGPER